MWNRTSPLRTILLLVVLGTLSVQAQNSVTSGPKYIEDLIAQNKLELAITTLYSEIEAFKKQGNYDTLVAYIPLVGSLTLNEGDSNAAIVGASSLVDIILQNSTAAVKAKALLQLNNIYFSAKQNDKVLEVAFEALKYAKLATPKDERLIATLHYNIGTAMLNLGNVEEAKPHLLKSKNILEGLPKKNLQELYNTYNSTGRYFASKSQLDSSTIYYKKAVAALNEMDKFEENRFYWMAIVKNNISLNLQNIGHTKEAIAFIKQAIENYQDFIDIAKDESKKSRAVRYRLATIDNLGTFYHGLGEYNKAVEIFNYSYLQKLQKLGPEDPNVVFSLVILSHGHLSAKNYEAAGEYADKALEIIDKNPSNFSYLHSYILAVRASVYEALEQMGLASKMYKKSEALFMQSFDGTYSSDYLDALINMSLFYSKYGDSEKAMQLAETGYRYTKRQDFQNALIHYSHIQNMADVHFELKNYPSALQFSGEALNFFNRNNFTVTSLSDSIQIEFNKPRSLLINAKSKYKLQNNRTEADLNELLSQVAEGIDILERRKTIINSTEDIQILIDDNNELFNFAKQLYLDLYEITGKEEYMLDLVTIHESSMYNRIRSRLNIRDNIAFADIPETVLQKEQQLKKNFATALNDQSNEKFDPFFEASTSWNHFLDSLKQHFPKYYKMRYATIESSLNDLQQNIDSNTSIVRYFFIEEKLFVFLVTKEDKHLYPLQFEQVKDHIPKLMNNNFEVEEFSAFLHQLYEVLWKPFDKHIQTNQVIIIPDRELYNLSFELLTPAPILDFKELTTNSLLAKYTISYNFSLLLNNGGSTTINVYSDNFVAFAPEFSKGMKDNYIIAVKDSVALDKNYLTLLPQPFSVDIAKEYSRIFDGSSFVNEKASKSVFITNAKEHKIIHIGTHAESNNVSPELSRLIFAKNISEADTSEETIDNNFLYTYEIYNQNLSSNLAILTACETGKPTYSAGEGMISLAHAFTYAGSESILTSLWKIDEKSSAEILAFFYDNLAEGMAKDEALKQAKLSYLATANGRELAPQYWAGLVIMGNTAPLELEAGAPWWYWAIGGLLVLFVLSVFFKNRRA